MNEDRHLPPEGLVQEDVLRNAGEPFFSAYDVGNLHEVVVHDTREMIGGESVGLYQNLIVDDGIVDSDPVAHDIIKDGLSLFGISQSDDKG